MEGLREGDNEADGDTEGENDGLSDGESEADGDSEGESEAEGPLVAAKISSATQFQVAAPVPLASKLTVTLLEEVWSLALYNDITEI